MASQKITPSDVLAQLGTCRSMADALPDAVSAQRASLQQAIDTATSYVKQALPKPGTYVTAGGALAMAGIAAVVGAAGGGFVGHKLGSKAAAAGQTRQLPQGGGASEPAGEDEEEVIVIPAAAFRRAAAARSGAARKPRPEPRSER